MFVEIWAEWGLPRQEWEAIWGPVLTLGSDHRYWRDADDDGSGRAEACVLTVEASSSREAERLIQAATRKAIRAAVQRARNVGIRELRVLHEGRCGEHPDFQTLREDYFF